MKIINTLKELEMLDDEKLKEGYFAGCDNTPNYTERSPAYWHGYMNGQVDFGHMPISTEQRELARLYLAKQRSH